MKDIIVVLTDDKTLLAMDDIKGVKILALLPDESIKDHEVLVEKLSKAHEIFLAKDESLHGIVYKFVDDEVNEVMGGALKEAYSEFIVFDYDDVIKALGDLWFELKDLAAKFKKALVLLDDKRLMDIASHNIGYNCETGMSYGTALNLLTDDHQDIAPINLGFADGDFVTITPEREVPQLDLWSEGNQRAAKRNGGSITTGPYLMATKNGHTTPFFADNAHTFAKWMAASDYVVPKSIKLEDNVLKVDFRISNGNDVLLTDPPLWLLFDTDALESGRNVIFVGTNSMNISISRQSAALVGMVTAAMEAHQTRSLTTANFIVPAENNLIISNPLNNYFGVLSAIGLTSSVDSVEVNNLLTTAIDEANKFGLSPTFVVNKAELDGLGSRAEKDLIGLVVQQLNELSEDNTEVRWAVIDINDYIDESLI